MYSAATGAELQLSSLHGTISRGDVKQVWSHFLQVLYQDRNSGSEKLQYMQEENYHERYH